jgi:glycosyltransferase involved in cell wall biosynthesis
VKSFPTVSVVVPVYNSELTLEPLVSRLETVLSPRVSRFEIILVNDGSRDESWRVIRELAGRHDRVRGISLARNYGQHNALLVGIRAATLEVIVTLDDDLQNPPEEIPKLLDELAEGHDVVYGTPELRQDDLWRRSTARLLRWILRNALGTDLARNVGSFRAFRSEIRGAFAGYQSSFVSIDVLLTWGTSRFGAVRVEHAAREVGRSNYSFARLLLTALDVITAFSTRPLRLASLIGFAFTLFGMAVLLFVLGRYLWLGYSLPGFPFLASVVAIFSGAQLFALGIIGEYLARVHLRSMGRPTGLIRESVGFSSRGARDADATS